MRRLLPQPTVEDIDIDGLAEHYAYPDTDAQVVRANMVSSVDGARGYWIDGPPHFFMYIDANGDPVDDSRRLVGDTLIWTDGDVTFRLESSLGRDRAIELAESLE